MKVLILVFVDVGLGQELTYLTISPEGYVLILVLVDVGLGLVKIDVNDELFTVLILVLVDVGLGHATIGGMHSTDE